MYIPCQTLMLETVSHCHDSRPLFFMLEVEAVSSFHHTLKKATTGLLLIVLFRLTQVIFVRLTVQKYVANRLLCHYRKIRMVTT